MVEQDSEEQLSEDHRYWFTANLGATALVILMFGLLLFVVQTYQLISQFDWNWPWIDLLTSNSQTHKVSPDAARLEEFTNVERSVICC